MKTKTCTGCGKSKPIERFRIRDRKTGRRHTRCISCLRAYRRQHYKQNKQKYSECAAYWRRVKREEKRVLLLEYLASHACVDCGENDPVVLEFDHRDPSEKVDNVANMMRGQTSWKRVLAEIEKCDIRCANCHRRKTAKEQGYYTVG